MINKLVLVALAAVLASSISLAAQNEHMVYLPPDTEVLTVIGNGFKLQLTHFDEMKECWNEAQKGASKVETPKTLGDSADFTPSEANGEKIADEMGANEIDSNSGGSGNGKGGQNQPDSNSGEKEHYGLVGEELLQWLNIRATTLTQRLDRYWEERLQFTDSLPLRVVLDIMLLNTVAQLEDLANQKMSQFDWIVKKLNGFSKMGRFNKAESYLEVSNFVGKLMSECYDVERNLKGTNNPGAKWLRNAFIVRRISKEQRFAKSLDDYVNKFLANQYSLMKRSILLDLFLGAKQPSTKLVYWAAEGRVSAEFPFASQDAIVNGMLN